MKQISIEELKKKIQPGDLVYGEYEDYPAHNGWRLFLGDFTIGLDTRESGSHGEMRFAKPGERRTKSIKKVVFVKDITYRCDLADFFHGYNEKYIKDYITQVVHPTTKETEIATLISKLESQLSDAKGELSKIKEGK